MNDIQITHNTETIISVGDASSTSMVNTMIARLTDDSVRIEQRNPLGVKDITWVARSEWSQFLMLCDAISAQWGDNTEGMP